MKTLFNLFALLFIISASFGQGQREYYQLKHYILKTEQQEKVVDEYLEKAYLPALHKAGINDIGVFKPIKNESDTLKSIYVLIPYSSLDQFVGLEAKLDNDKKYQKAGSDYINATHDNLPYLRIKSTLMKAFEGMLKHQVPTFESAKKDRVYELRSYESGTEKLFHNKVHMFNIGGEIDLFDKLGFNAVFYSEVISGANMPNLIYMTSFSDMASRDSHWKTFGESPEWGEMKVKPIYQNNMNKLDKFLLYPTDYSDY
ncbi:MAG: NIPSNAP family protein [Cyclobacteriaceae bacterium]|nr:NIPSNAP family protein [Cyclobacteriaceae bacterium]